MLEVEGLPKSAWLHPAKVLVSAGEQELILCN